MWPSTSATAATAGSGHKPLARTERVNYSAGSLCGSVACPIIVLRQAQHEDTAFVASLSKMNLILSLLCCT
jgi:hypothetical protein